MNKETLQNPGKSHSGDYLTDIIKLNHQDTNLKTYEKRIASFY